MRRFFGRFRDLFRRRRLLAALEEDVAAHRDELVAEHLARGATRARAERAAALELGNTTQIRESYREAAGVPFIETTLLDARYALRLLARSPGFAAVALLSLALGIGANTALFSVAGALFLRKLPVRDPQRVVLLTWEAQAHPLFADYDGTSWEDGSGRWTGSSFPPGTFRQMREQASDLADVFAFADFQQLNVNADGDSQIAEGALVSGSYFSALGLNPAAGRTISDADDTPGSAPVAMISYRYWQRRFGGNPAILGKRITVNTKPATLIGVAPQGFDGTLQIDRVPDVMLPLGQNPNPEDLPVMPDDLDWWVNIMARLKPGVAPQQAQARMNAIFRQTTWDAWQHNAAQPRKDRTLEKRDQRNLATLVVEAGAPGLMEDRREFSTPLFLLACVLGLVLLIACANLSNLLLARAAARGKEVAVRLSLGARRGRVIRQLLTESLLLALAGGILGTGLAYLGKDALALAFSATIEPQLDWRVLAFALVLSAAAGIIFGLAPAARATRVEVAPTLKKNAPTLAGRSRLSNTLIVVQVAISVVLLIAAGLFSRTLYNLSTVKLGFDPANLLLFRFKPQLSGYKPQQLAMLYAQLQRSIEAVPGVQSVTYSRHPLLAGSLRADRVVLEGAGDPGNSSRGLAEGTGSPGAESTAINVVAPNFFNVMRMPLISGRQFNNIDDANSPRVAVVNQAFVEHFLHNDPHALGRRFRFSNLKTPLVEIVGIVGNSKYTNLRRDRPIVYTAFPQENIPGQMSFAVRTGGPPDAVMPAVREAIRRVDSNLPIYDVGTQQGYQRSSMAAERLFAQLSVGFGVLALLLAMIGL
jgi:predicted permease